MEFGGTIFVFLASVLMIAIGILNIKHYFNVNRTGEDITFNNDPNRYEKNHEIQLLKGKSATKYAWLYLVQGIVFLIIGDFIFVCIIWIFLDF